jgi:hypothetical protein
MNDEMDIGPALIDAVHSITRGHTIIEGTVLAVYTDPGDPDNPSFTADVQVGESTFNNVPLKVLVGSQASVIEIPAVGSNVLMTFRDGNIQRYQMLFIDQVDRLLITCQSKVQFNQGQLGGIVKVIPLTTALNAGQNDTNDLKTLIAGWTPVPNDGGASLKAILATWYNDQLTVTEQSTIEDSTILH